MVNLLEVRDLSIHYGARKALGGVNLEVREHEIFGIIGPANSGKTSFLRALNRMDLFTPSMRVEGEVIFEGRDIKRPHAHRPCEQETNKVDAEESSPTGDQAPAWTHVCPSQVTSASPAINTTTPAARAGVSVSPSHSTDAATIASKLPAIITG